MNIDEQSEKVKVFFELLNRFSDKSKLKVLIYLFGEVDNNQINNKDEANPDLVEDDDLIIFNMETLGYSKQVSEVFLKYNIYLYNLHIDDKKKYIYLDNGSIIGLKITFLEKFAITAFEHLSFIDKIDVLAEITIRYDNRTYFNENITELTFSDEEAGVNIAKRVMDFKKKYIE